MKKLMTIFGAFFFASVVLTSCGDVNIEDLDKDIDNEEDAVEALITVMKAEMELMEKKMGPMQELADMADRNEDIVEASEDVWDKIIDEEWDEDDLEDADNWDEYEDLKDEFEDIMEDYFEKYSEKLNNDMEEEYYEEDDYDDEWSYEFEESFMEECTSKDYLALYDYCECALEEIMYEYTPNELENLDPDEALEFIQFDTDCLELIDYDEY